MAAQDRSVNGKHDRSRSVGFLRPAGRASLRDGKSLSVSSAGLGRRQGVARRSKMSAACPLSAVGEPAARSKGC